MARLPYLEAEQIAPEYRDMLKEELRKMGVKDAAQWVPPPARSSILDRCARRCAQVRAIPPGT